MQLKEFDIILDIKQSLSIPYIEVVRGDTETNVFNIKLTNGGKEYPVRDNIIEIAFAKPDGTTVLQDENNGITITNAIEGEITCLLKTNTIAVPGKVLGEVRIKNDNSLLTSSQFQFYVRQSIR